MTASQGPSWPGVYRVLIAASALTATLAARGESSTVTLAKPETRAVKVDHIFVPPSMKKAIYKDMERLGFSGGAVACVRSDLACPRRPALTTQKPGADGSGTNFQHVTCPRITFGDAPAVHLRGLVGRTTVTDPKQISKREGAVVYLLRNVACARQGESFSYSFDLVVKVAEHGVAATYVLPVRVKAKPKASPLWADGEARWLGVSRMGGPAR